MIRPCPKCAEPLTGRQMLAHKCDGKPENSEDEPLEPEDAGDEA